MEIAESIYVQDIHKAWSKAQIREERMYHVPRIAEHD